MDGRLQSIGRWAVYPSFFFPTPSRPSPWRLSHRPAMNCQGRQGRETFIWDSNHLSNCGKASPFSKHPVSFPGVGGQDGASSGPGGLRAHRLQPMDAQAAAARGLGRTGPKKQKQPSRKQAGPGAARHRAALGTGSQVAGDFSHGTYPHRRGRRAGSAGIRRPDRPRAGARRTA